MKIQLKTAAPTLQEIQQKLSASLPQFTYSMRGSNMLIIRKSSTSAAVVMVRGDKIICNENFPSIIGNLIFVMTMLLLGIIIPLIIYFIAVFPGQKAVRNTVAEVLTQEYGTTAARSSDLQTA